MLAFFSMIVNALIFSVIGVTVFGISFYVADKLTPVDLWKGVVEEKNVALGILAGSIALAIGMIVAAALKG